MSSSPRMPLQGPAMPSDTPTASVATESTQASLESYLSNPDPSNTLPSLKLLHKEVLRKGKGQANSTDLRRLYKLYPILLDRVFGEVEIVGSRKVESNGGWLACSTRFMDSHGPIGLQHISHHLPHQLPNMRMRLQPLSQSRAVCNEWTIHVDSVGMSIEGAMLFDLLSCSNVQKEVNGRSERQTNGKINSEGEIGGRGRLFNVIREAPNSVQFLFPMAQLPVMSKSVIQRSPSTNALKCGNATRLFCGGCLLRHPPPQHASVTRLGSMRRLLDAFTIPLNGRMTAVADSSRSHPSQLYKSWIKNGLRGLTRHNPYNSLLLEYCGFYFPHLQVMTSGRSGDRSGDNNAVVHNSHRGGGGGGGGGGSMMITSPSVPITMPHCSTNTSPMSAALISVGRWGVQRLEREREVFLRLIIEFWLCQNAMLSHGSLHGQPAMNPLGILPYSHTIGRSGASAAVTLSSFNPLETQITGEYTPPADMSLHGLLVLCTYLLADPSVKDAWSKLGDSRGGGRREFVDGHMGGPRTVLSPPLAILQPYVFNFLSLSFNRCPLWENFTAFALCTELWLVWLQPWLARDIMSGHPVSPSSSPSVNARREWLVSLPNTLSVSLLTRCPCWYAHEGAFVLHPEYRVYVAGTYTLYTLLFAAFVNRARVLMVFSTDLMDFLESCEIVTEQDSPQRLLQLGIKDHERQLVLDHRASMLPHIGSYPHPKLSAYREQAQMLLEELSTQSREMISTVTNGGVASELLSKTVNLISTGVAGRIKHVVAGNHKRVEDYVDSSLRRIFDISQDWQPAVTKEGGTGVFHNCNPEPERNCGLFLTTSGRKQVALGRRACRREDVSYMGDPLLRPQESHEIPGLTSALVWLSVWLNRKYGLGTDNELQAIQEDALGMGGLHEDEKPSNDILKAKEYGISMARKQSKSSGFRFNLRFLADYRNLVFGGTCLSLLLLVIFVSTSL